MIERARGMAADLADAQDIAEQATALLAGYAPRDILDAERVLQELMAASDRAPLWTAARVISGGGPCFDEGFDYFRGWLIAQGREVFEGAVADADRLAELPEIRASAPEEIEPDGEEILGIARDAYERATGAELPESAFTLNRPAVGPDLDFDDRERMTALLPRLTALYPG
ncbi:DUF4240 domain-containing protein [Streptomyces sp. NBC_00638]|nr:DUF4240 domain-containing protein [Streptomyces sp. NBC_00568]MCX5004914.1 DUF4240 domain-containing protein [Streptomyces sp. NBC_00638]